MDQATLEFLTKQRVSVISIHQEDHSVHAATVHFAYHSETNSFYFLTHEASRKCRSLLSGNESTASLVIGFSEEACATFQADGFIKILKAEELDSGWEVYGAKYPERVGAKGHAGVVLLRFTPEWHRFSDIDVKERFKS